MSNVSPLLMKGAILVLEPNTGIPLNTINLQYNPESIRRSIQPQSVGDLPDRTEVLRLKGPPIETIHSDVEIDATDHFPAVLPTTTPFRIPPHLSPFTLLL